MGLSLLGLTVTFGILLVTLVEKFTDGGWMTLLITGTVIGFCIINRVHYETVERKYARRTGICLGRNTIA